jgi:uncharacterized membrane protein YdbT with pleckstrin-like domain
MSEEQIIFRGSPSAMTRFGSLFLAFLVMAGATAGAILVPRFPYQYILAGIAALAFIYLLAVIFIVKTTQYEVTTERVRVRHGILTKRTEELELYRALDTSLIEPLAMRLLGLGTVEIRTADATTPYVCLEAIHRARQLREDLRKSIEECRDRKRVRMTEFDHSQENTGPEPESPST